MTILSRALILLLLLTSPAFAMTQGGQPSKFGIVWGNNAGASYIRVIPSGSQIGIQNCAASLTDGFPPLTFTPAAQGGCPPFGQDFNGILKQITQWAQWQAAGGPQIYDASFQTAIGGYPRGALVQSAILPGRVWYSTADNNMTNPDDQTGAAVTWTAQPGTNAAGTPVATFAAAGPPNSVAANGLSVGNAASNATGRANADAYWLFSFLWTNCSTCTLFNSAGGTVGKGANFGADWVANRAIATPDMRGTAQVGNDGGTNRLSGVPVTTGAITTNASVIGENLHTLSTAELASHFHSTSTSDPGHNHTVTINDPQHFHQANMAGASHYHGASIADPGHYHSAGISDPTHGHNINSNRTGLRSDINTWSTDGGTGVGGGGAFGPATSFTIAGNGTGVRVNSNHGLDTVYSVGTGVYLTSANGTNLTTSVAAGDYINTSNGANQTYSKATGVTATTPAGQTTSVTMTSPNGGNTTYSAGSGSAHNTVPRSIVVTWNLAL